MSSRTFPCLYDEGVVEMLILVDLPVFTPPDVSPPEIAALMLLEEDRIAADIVDLK